MRSLWQTYAMKADAIIFMVDSADANRLDEARSELIGLLATPVIAHIPVMIFANKSDLQVTQDRWIAVCVNNGFDDSDSRVQTTLMTDCMNAK